MTLKLRVIKDDIEVIVYDNIDTIDLWVDDDNEIVFDFILEAGKDN